MEAPLALGSVLALGYANKGHVSRRRLHIQFPCCVALQWISTSFGFREYPLPKRHNVVYIQPSSLKRRTHDSPCLARSAATFPVLFCFADARSVNARACTRISETAAANVQGSSLANRNTVKRIHWNVFSQPTPGAAFDHVDDNRLIWSVAAWWHCRRQHRAAVATQPHIGILLPYTEL